VDSLSPEISVASSTTGAFRVVAVTTCAACETVTAEVWLSAIDRAVGDAVRQWQCGSRASSGNQRPRVTRRAAAEICSRLAVAAARGAGHRAPTARAS
jgi:hypothetical protein